MLTLSVRGMATHGQFLPAPGDDRLTAAGRDKWNILLSIPNEFFVPRGGANDPHFDNAMVGLYLYADPESSNGIFGWKITSQAYYQNDLPTVGHMIAQVNSTYLLVRKQIDIQELLPLLNVSIVPATP